MAVSKNAKEFDLQKALVLWLTGNPDRNGVLRGVAHLSPRVTFWHTPNGGERDAFEAKRLKESGVIPGIHDLFFLRPTRFTEGVYGLLFGLELKEPNGKGRLSTAQKLMHPRLISSGLAASIVLDSLPECKDWLIKNGLAIP